MPVGYGSKFELTKLSTSEIGHIAIHHQKGTNWASLLKLFVTLGEVALTIIPGVGAVAGTGIALTGSAVRTGIDVAAGNPITATTLGLDIASGILPGVLHGVKAGIGAYKGGQFITKDISALELTTNIKKELGIAEGPWGVGRGYEKHISLERTAGKDAFQQWGKSNGKGDFYINKLGGTRRSIQDSLVNMKTAMEAGLNTGRGTLGKLLPDSHWEKLEGLLEKTTNEIGTKGSQAIIEAGTYRYQTLEKDLKGLGLSELEIDELLRISRLEMSELNKMIMISGILEGRAGTDNLAILLRKINNKMNYSIGVSKLGNKDIAAAMHNKSWASKQIAKYNRAILRPSSSEYNDLIVQPMQAIWDPSDLGRAPIEFVYKKLKNAIKFESKLIKRLIKQGKSLEEVFIKSGGTIMDDSVILGFKIIQDIGPFMLVQISFRPFESGAKHKMWGGRPTNNFGGKKPVFVQATKTQLERLLKGGMPYYLKKWAHARGGAPVGASAFGLGNLAAESTVMLPFINTGLMRNILSLTSNVVSNAGKMAKGHWADQWVSKFQGSFTRNIQGRTGRLFGKIILGGIGAKYFGHKIGAVIGKESQRILSTVTKALVTAEGRKTGSFASNFGRAFKGQVAKRTMASVTHYTKRHARRVNPNSGVLQSISANRKLGFVRRIPSSVGSDVMNRFRFKV